MPKCKDCKNYKKIDERQGDCFSHVVSGEKDSKECPTSSYRAKENNQDVCNN